MRRSNEQRRADQERCTAKQFVENHGDLLFDASRATVGAANTSSS
jgi:hypothetical protein